MSLQTHKLTLVIAVGKAGQVWLEFKNAKLASFSNWCIYKKSQCCNSLFPFRNWCIWLVNKLQGEAYLI